jgi:ligand-binding SRPBCC domain-containing protein
MSRRRSSSTYIKESVIRASPARVFAFHELPDALARLTPPWESSRVIQMAKISEVGSEAIIETRILGLIPVRWIARHTIYDPPRVFEDVQLKGPFRFWRHRHLVAPHADGAVLRDEIEYEPPFSFIGRLVEPLLITPRLEKLFDYRHAATRAWCEKGSDG